MPIKSETRRVVYIHPKGYYAVVKRRGKGKLGGEYKFNETIYPPFPWQKNEPKPKPKPQPVRTVTVEHVTEPDKARFRRNLKMTFTTNYSDTDTLKPEGEYECVIKRAYQTATISLISYIEVNCSIRTDVENPCQGMIFYKLWRRIPQNMTEADKSCYGYSSKQINVLSQAAGLPEGKTYDSLDDWCKDLQGRPVRVVLKHETYNGKKREKVKWFNVSAVPALTQNSYEDISEDMFEDLEDDEDVPF